MLGGQTNTKYSRGSISKNLWFCCSVTIIMHLTQLWVYLATITKYCIDMWSFTYRNRRAPWVDWFLWGYKWTIAPSSLFDGHHLRLNKNGWFGRLLHVRVKCEWDHQGPKQEMTTFFLRNTLISFTWSRGMLVVSTLRNVRSSLATIHEYPGLCVYLCLTTCLMLTCKFALRENVWVCR